MKSLILCFVIVFTLCNSISNCNQQPDSAIENSNTLDYKSAEYIYLFQMESDTLYLDSAIVCIDIALESCLEENLLNKLKIRKLGLLSEKKKYQEALEFINRSIDEDVLSGLPYYKRFLVNRFNAMYYQHTEDYHSRDSCLKAILFDIEDFLSRNERKVNQLKTQNDPIHFLENPLHIPLMQYYFYQSMLISNAQFETKLKEELSKGHISDFFYFEVLGFIESADLMYFDVF